MLENDHVQSNELQLYNKLASLMLCIEEEAHYLFIYRVQSSKLGELVAILQQSL